MIPYVVFITIVGMFAFGAWLYSRKFYTRYDRATVKSFAVILFLTALLSPVYYEFPPSPVDGVVITIQNGNVVEHKFGTFCWEWSNSCTTTLANPVVLSSTVTPITVNPKVKFITYTLEVEIMNPDKFYAYGNRMELEAAYTKFKNDGSNPPHALSLNKYVLGTQAKCIEDEIARIVAFHVNEFNQLHSKEIAEFYNPLDQNQVNNFAALVMNKINPYLEEVGLHATFRSFTVDDR